MEKPLCNCSHSDLMVAVETGLNSCEEFLDDLTDFSLMNKLSVKRSIND